MIEICECNNIVKQLNSTIVGKKIKDIIIGLSEHKFAFYSPNINEMAKKVINKKISSSESHAGIIQINIEDYFLYITDGACPKYYDKDFPSKHQLGILFDDNTGLFLTIQMYGAIGIYQTGLCNNPYYISSCTRINPLDKAFTYDYFVKLYNDALSNKKKMSLKAFLATEQRIPGLGNGTLQDILYNACLDPRYDVRFLSFDELRKLYESIINTINEIINLGGRDTEKDLFGNNGRYCTKLSKLTVGKECSKCHTIIQKTNYMGGTIYFCSTCQKSK